MNGDSRRSARIAGAWPVLFLLLVAACSSDKSPAGAVVVSGANAPLAAIDDTVQLTAVAVDHQGDPVPNVTFSWTTSDPAVATVNGSGLVTARGNGTATITATGSNDWPGSTQVQVEQVPVAIAVSPESWSAVWVGARQQFSAVATDANGHTIGDADVTWSTSDAATVAVDNTGLATAMDAGSNVLVTAQAAAASDSVDVSVPPDVAARAGAMYTVWLARSDAAPALIVNGEIKVPDDVITSVSYEDPVSPWPHSLPGVTAVRNTVHKFQWEGQRIGLLTDMANGAGTFRAMNRISEWGILSLADATDFQLEGNRIGLMRVGGHFRVKEGLSGPWTVLADSGAARFQLEGNRIGLLHDDGMFRVKDGIDGAWTVLVAAGDAPRFQLEGNRIGVLSAAGEFRVKDGIDGAWTVLAADDAADFRLQGNRIALLHEDGRFRVKDGIHGEWTTLATDPIRQFELEGDRIGILFDSGVFQVKDGIHGPWTVLATENVREIQLQGNRIGALLEDGTLRVRAGIANDWSDTPAYGAGVTQFRLVVNVPVQPFRTTPGYYNAKQAECNGYDDPDDDNDCYHVSGFDLPVSNYGWYCGQGRPYDYQAIIRETRYLTDSLDALCRHHDTVGSWYPGAGGFGSGEFFAPCIVRYGLHYGRLTRDGILLTHGNDTQQGWDDAWATVGMVNLKDALDNYFIHTNGCSDDDLAAFVDDTAWRAN